MQVKTQYGWCQIREATYSIGGRKALSLFDMEGRPVITLTVNIPEVQLEPGEFFVKTWSENEEIAEDCLKSGLFVDTGKRWQTGFTLAQVWRLA